MKEMLLEKSQLLRLKENWRNVLDPRKGYQKGMKVQKKQKLSQVEKQMVDKYIAEDDESEDSEDN